MVPPLCVRCGQSLEAWGENALGAGLCPFCRVTPPAYEAARAWGRMEGSIRSAIHRLKYRRDVSLADVLAAQMLAVVEREGWQVDGVVPVPLGPARLRERGFNQAALLAFPLALGLRLPYWGQVLVRWRETRTQVGLSAAERRRNVAGAFRVVREEPIMRKTVLLVDDVMTTGATLDAAARALKKGGAARVYALVAARAVLRAP